MICVVFSEQPRIHWMSIVDQCLTEIYSQCRWFFVLLFCFLSQVNKTHLGTDYSFTFTLLKQFSMLILYHDQHLCILLSNLAGIFC